MNNDYNIIVRTSFNLYETPIQFLIYESDSTRYANKLIAASYVNTHGLSDDITSEIISGAGFYLGRRPMQRGRETYHRIERNIGLGDLLHTILVSEDATVDSLEESIDSEHMGVSYVISTNDIKADVSRHVMKKYGLPKEWEGQYYELFEHTIHELNVVVNPDYEDLYGEIKAVSIRASEDEILSIVEDALLHNVLTIPESDVQGVFDPSWSMKDYMLNNSDVMSEKLSEMKPLHSYDEPINPNIATMERVPFPAQAHMIQGILNGFKNEDSIICSGDMGTGKSILSIAVAHVMSETKKENNSETGMSVIISAPGITLRKWKHHEILKTLPNAKVEIIKSDKRAIEIYQAYKNGYRTPKGEIHFYLISIDKAKSSHPTHFAGLWKRIKGTVDQYTWHCPDCYNPMEKIVKGQREYLEWSDIAQGSEPSQEDILEAMESHRLNPNGIPYGHDIKWKKTKKYMKCSHYDENGLKTSCDSKLYRPAVKSRGETNRNPSHNISHILGKLNGLIDLYIADEVHKSKGSDTGRGMAFGNLVKSAKKNLLLTGTLVNGKSSSVKEILWKTDPKSLLSKGFSNSTSDLEWAKRYGKLEKTVPIEDDDIRPGSRKTYQPYEAPGIAPHMTSQFLLHKAGFMELGDMGLPLVELKEIPVFVDMEEEHAENYKKLHMELTEKCSVYAAMGLKGAWSKFTPATIMYADRPDLGADIRIGEDRFQAPVISGHHPKELKLVEIVKNELAEGRNCVIYNNYTGTYGMNERIQEVLDAHGISSEILNETNTERRSEELDELEARQVPVIITNIKNVEVGLDLLFWPTIINYQMTYEVATFRQANRRNWRIGQHKESRCYILVYNGTQQMHQFQKLMSGRGHAMLTEGRLDKSDLARFSKDSQSELATDLADCFAEGDLAEAWSDLAARDLDSIEIVEEERLKEVVQERMRELTNETRAMCGLPPLADDDLDNNEIDSFMSLFYEEHSESVLELFKGTTSNLFAEAANPWHDVISTRVDDSKDEIAPDIKVAIVDKILDEVFV